METKIAELDTGGSRNITHGPTLWNESQLAISGAPQAPAHPARDAPLDGAPHHRPRWRHCCTLSLHLLQQQLQQTADQCREDRREAAEREGRLEVYSHSTTSVGYRIGTAAKESRAFEGKEEARLLGTEAYS